MKKFFRPIILVLLVFCFAALSSQMPLTSARSDDRDANGEDLYAIPQAIKQYIADAHFDGKVDSPAFKKGVQRLRLDRETFNDVMRNYSQRQLFEFYNGESVFTAVTDPKGRHHIMVFKAREEGDENNGRFKIVDDNYKRLYERTNIPEAHFRAVIEILKPIKQVELPKKDLPPMSVPEFLDSIKDKVGEKDHKNIMLTFKRAERNSQSLIKAVRLLETEEERQGAYWLLANMKDYGDSSFFYDEEEAKVHDFVHHDAEYLTAEHFYEIVHYAYEARKLYPWARSLSEDDFRVWVLQYRHTQHPLAPGMRAHMFNALKPYATTLTDMEDALHQINLIAWCFIQYTPKLRYMTDEDLRGILACNEGRCEEQTNFGMAMLRSAGIPNTMVYTPCYPTRDSNHGWNMAFIGDRILSFDGSQPKFEKPYFENCMQEDLAKVYEVSLGRGTVDHTKHFTPVADVKMRVDKKYVGQDVFICVWNNEMWLAVAKATVAEDKTVLFEDVGNRKDYMYCIATENRKYDQATKGLETMGTFILNTRGEMEKIVTKSSVRRRRTAPIPWKLRGNDTESQEKFYLKRWDGFLWVDMGEIEFAPDGSATVTGEADKLYRIAREDGTTFRRPFMLKKDEDGNVKVVIH